LSGEKAMQAEREQLASYSLVGGETTPYLVAIMRGDDTHILLLERNSRLFLPAFSVPRKQRVAPNLLAAVRDRLGLYVVCRFSFAFSRPEHEVACVVLDRLGVSSQNEGLWMTLSEVRKEHCDLSTWEALEEIRERIRLHAEGNPARTFVSARWFDEVSTWIDTCLQRRGMRLNGLSAQYNMGPDFSLLRVNTSGSGMWFKAVGCPNLREFHLTRKLAELALPHLPEILDVHVPWNAWLMAEAKGCALDESDESEKWPTVARCLAELQLASVPHTGALLASGCVDLRTVSLEDQIEPYLRGVAHLMESQQSNKVRKLEPDDLRLIGRHLRTACRQVEGLLLPETLGHSDFSDGNIFVNRQGTTFLDWAQGHIGNPFLTFEYLLLLLRRATSDDVQQSTAVRREYLRPWEAVCSHREIALSVEAAPLLAVFAYALVCGGSRQDAPSDDSRIAGYLRALARRLHLEAVRLEAR
jgi:Phosphotransferase enzyme family